MTVQFETLEYDIAGVHTVVKAIGRGKPILFLHGAATLEGFDFAEGLADRFACTAPVIQAWAIPATHRTCRGWRILSSTISTFSTH